MTEPQQGESIRMRSRFAVLMVADMVGYSLLMDRDEKQAISAIRELKDTYLEPVVLSHSGEILKRMGDGWIFAFASVADQVRCSMEVQSNLTGHGLIKLRIGAHIGEILEDEDDFYGAVVNLAQRLQTEAPPSGLMVSQDLHRQLPNELQEIFRDAGSFRLKNIAQPVNGFQWRPQVHVAGDTGQAHGVADDVPTIAVESFEYAPDEANPRAVAADLRDQLIMRLSQRTGVRVLDDSSQAIRDAVYVLQGRLRVSGDRGRLNLRFELPAEGRTMWSQSYEGDTSDIFRFSDELIERADADLRLQINAFDGERIANLPDDALSISELRSRAATMFYKCTVESYEHACRLMDRALRLNPSDAMALAMRVEGQVVLAAARHTQLDEAQVQALEADVNKAVEVSPRSDYIFSTRSAFKIFVTRDIDGAIADAQRTLSLGPAYATAHETMGLAALLAGDFTGSSYYLQKSISLAETDPFLPLHLFMLAICLHFMGERREAIKTIDRAIQLGPRQRCYHLFRAFCCRAMGDDMAAAESDKIVDRLPREPSVLAIRPALPDAHQEFANLFAPS